MNQPRPEYPRPQMVRPDWMNLNGEWNFEFDFGNSGKDRKLFESPSFSQKIIVPFCPESKLSGIEYTDFMQAVWYHRTFSVPADWKSDRILLHFGACDYKTTVWINGCEAGTHSGGYSSFTFDITKKLTDGENQLVVCAEDNNRSGCQPRGKQCYWYASSGCDYTRTTGIWQTVWMEHVPATYLSSYKAFPDPKNGCVHLEFKPDGAQSGYTITAAASLNGKSVGTKTVTDSTRMTLPLSEVELWDLEHPTLYDLELTISANGASDTVSSYFGMRTITWDNKVMKLNDRPVFQRLVLDQGFYPTGIYTAPTDEDLKNDIKLSMDMGFNGARMHQKIFEERYLYYADKMGYLIWGEHANWGLNTTRAEAIEQFVPEWLESMERDFNHPALIGWCPFNETWEINGQPQDDEVIRMTYDITKKMDPTRPVIDTSGFYHVLTDIFDVHDYTQDPAEFAKKMETLHSGKPEEYFVDRSKRETFTGQPYFVSEYGGICWNSEVANGWGYGNAPKSETEFIERYRGLTEALLFNDEICAFCYTQLYDVEQETNGLYRYDRTPKFDPAIFKAINSQKAKIEE